MKFRYAFKTFVCHEILEILVLMDADNQKTKITRKQTSNVFWRIMRLGKYKKKNIQTK